MKPDVVGRPVIALAAVALLIAAFLVGAMLAPAAAQAQATAAAPEARPYQVEWVYRVKYGYQGEWWRLFQKIQVAILDREKQLGYVSDYVVQRPGLHASEDSRWDFRVIITYPNWAGSTHEGEVERQLFPDRQAEQHDEQRRWELTLNHWDLPIHAVDPHSPGD